MTSAARAQRNPALVVAGLLLLCAPAAWAQVPTGPCGTPPVPSAGSIPFRDITGLAGAPALGALLLLSLTRLRRRRRT